MTLAPSRPNLGASPPAAPAPGMAPQPPPERMPPAPPDRYRRYHIDTNHAPDRADLPTRFRVEVNRFELAKLLFKEIREYWGDWDVVLSRPCVYGVFSGPVGGFAPRPHLCVGCLRCTIQHPEAVTIRRNPEWVAWGDDFLTPPMVETLQHEASLGAVPVKGQGYRGRMGGTGWDGIWTDMSEIVRPTRDGIHGREFISTVVDIGSKPMYLRFDAAGMPSGELPEVVQTQLPLLLDLPPVDATTPTIAAIWAGAAHDMQTLAMLPLEVMRREGLSGPQLVPVVGSGMGDPATLVELGRAPQMVAITETGLAPAVREALPSSRIMLRQPFVPGWRESLMAAFDQGLRVFHLVADYHGRGDGAFVRDLVLDAHRLLVERGVRDQVTLIGGGGIVMAEHVPKAIICGLDAVSLDTPLMLALQCQPQGQVNNREGAMFRLPPGLEGDVTWGVQRVKNLCSAWRDQLLEIMGAMGLREVRRLRGELGRAMFQEDLEREAFGGIDGFRD
jgi:hypothetical protein